MNTTSTFLTKKKILIFIRVYQFVLDFTVKQYSFLYSFFFFFVFRALSFSFLENDIHFLKNSQSKRHSMPTTTLWDTVAWIMNIFYLTAQEKSRLLLKQGSERTVCIPSLLNYWGELASHWRNKYFQNKSLLRECLHDR